MCDLPVRTFRRVVFTPLLQISKGNGGGADHYSECHDVAAVILHHLQEHCDRLLTW